MAFAINDEGTICAVALREGGAYFDEVPENDHEFMRYLEPDEEVTEAEVEDARKHVRARRRAKAEMAKRLA